MVDETAQYMNMGKNPAGFEGLGEDTTLEGAEGAEGAEGVEDVEPERSGEYDEPPQNDRFSPEPEAEPEEVLAPKQLLWSSSASTRNSCSAPLSGASTPMSRLTSTSHSRSTSTSQSKRSTLEALKAGQLGSDTSAVLEVASKKLEYKLSALNVKKRKLDQVHDRDQEKERALAQEWELAARERILEKEHIRQREREAHLERMIKLQIDLARTGGHRQGHRQGQGMGMGMGMGIPPPNADVNYELGFNLHNY